jgi:hypothetical protein
MESTLMKRLWFIAILAASASACVEGNNPVQLLSAVPFEPESCDRADQAVLRGRLNYAVNSSYVTTFSIFSPVIETEDVGAVAFFCEEVVYSYQSEKPTIGFSDESLAIHCAVPPGASPDDSYVGLDLIGTEARAKLDGAVPAAPDAMTLLVTVKLRGRSPNGRQVETNEVTFPIEITRSGVGCGGGAVLPEDPAAFPCGYPGQDAFFNRFTCG